MFNQSYLHRCVLQPIGDRYEFYNWFLLKVELSVFLNVIAM